MTAEHICSKITITLSFVWAVTLSTFINSHCNKLSVNSWPGGGTRGGSVVGSWCRGLQNLVLFQRRFNKNRPSLGSRGIFLNTSYTYLEDWHFVFVGKEIGNNYKRSHILLTWHLNSLVEGVDNKIRTNSFLLSDSSSSFSIVWNNQTPMNALTFHTPNFAFSLEKVPLSHTFKEKLCNPFQYQNSQLFSIPTTLKRTGKTSLRV